MNTNTAVINSFRQRILNRERLIGFWSLMTSTVTVEIAGLTDFDWLVLDGEHSPTSIPHLMAQLQTLNGNQVAAVGRPAENSPALIKQFLDIGFYNLLIPFIESADQARQAVLATRYPPEGIRGVAGQHRSNRFGTVAHYNENINEQICVLLQIETMAGVQALDEILQVEGVDGIFIGPSDLAAACGHLGNPSHPEVQATIRDIHERAQAAGKATGILAPVQADAQRYIEWGVNFVAVGTDLGLYKQALFQLRDNFR